jgi:ubiquinone/menaquinone biosynthesis C-methylase UbiE
MIDEGKKSQIAEAYDQWAETYDTDQNRTRDLAGKILRQVDFDLVGRNIIEVGCGTGRNTEWLTRARSGLSGLLALDFSEAMLARARARVNDSRVRFVQHDVRGKWPVADDSADVVIVMLVLEHVERLEPVFAEAARTLRAGGEMFICELHPARQLLGKQAEFTNAKTGAHTRVTAFLHATADYLEAGMSAGFKVLNKGEWRDADSPVDAPPRLLSLHFRLTPV